MKDIYIKRTIKIIIFIAGFLGIFALATNVLRLKCYFTNTTVSPETETWDSFYSLEKDSVDVMFVGSSHVYNGINPLVFYEVTGLKGFDLATSNQDMAMGYRVVEEIFRYQTPKYLVMETQSFFYNPFHFDMCDPYYKMTYDDMRWTRSKLDGLNEWLAFSTNEKLINRVFPLFDYHSRWDELSWDDFFSKRLATNIEGYCYTFYPYPNEFKGYAIEEKYADIAPICFEYFDKIKQICDEHGTTIILVSIPDGKTNSTRADMMFDLAVSRGVSFYDYNSKEGFAKTGVLENEWRDLSHLNATGANKFTRVFAYTLIDEKKIETREASDELWNEKVKNWYDIYEDGVKKQAEELEKEGN